MVVIRLGLAFIVDFIFLSCFFFPITYLYFGKWLMSYEDHYWGILDPICLVFLFAIFAYFILREAYVGWIVGKKVLHMRIVNIEEKKIGLSRSAIRNLLRIVDGLPAFNILGMIFIGSSPRGQRFGYRVARTYVVRAWTEISSSVQLYICCP